MRKMLFTAALAVLFATPASAQNQGPLLRKAVFANNLASIRALISSKSVVNAANDDGVTPLMIAAALGNTDVIRLLVAAGANLEAQTKEHKVTALIFAADFSKLDAVQALVTSGASTKATDDNGYSSIDYAAIPNTDDVPPAVTEVEAKLRSDRSMATITFLLTKGTEVKQCTPGVCSGPALANIVGSVLAVGTQARLNELLHRAKTE